MRRRHYDDQRIFNAPTTEKIPNFSSGDTLDGPEVEGEYGCPVRMENKIGTVQNGLSCEGPLHDDQPMYSTKKRP